MEPKRLAGFLLINKPRGISSFAVIEQLKKLFIEKIRIGHAGSLGRFATGLLIIAIDRSATKQCHRLEALNKTYIAKAKLGELTDTLDMFGTVLKEELATLTKEALITSIDSFGPTYNQAPALYSSVRHEGIPLHVLTRKKLYTPKELEAIAQTKAKEVTLYSLELLEFTPPFFTLKAEVSQGTSIRVLVNDIAKRAETIATVYDLERTAIGPFTVDEALYLQQLNSIEDIEQYLIPDLVERLDTSAPPL